MKAELCETRRYLKSISNTPKFNLILEKAKLTPTQRKALIMAVLQGFSIRKISLEMSLSDSSVYRLLNAGYNNVLLFLRSNKVDGFDGFDT